MADGTSWFDEMHLDHALREKELVNACPTSTIGGQALSFATLRLPVPDCWTVEISLGTADLKYTLYAYPWDCRPQHERFALIPGIAPLPCTRT